MKTPAALNQLFEKEMDRKDFFKHAAAITLFVAGGGAIVSSLTKSMKRGQFTGPLSGYGASAYGGMQATTTQVRQ